MSAFALCGDRIAVLEGGTLYVKQGRLDVLGRRDRQRVCLNGQTISNSSGTFATAETVQSKYIYGYGGDDVIDCTFLWSCYVNGGDGSDRIWASGSNDTLEGGEDDVFYGGDGNDCWTAGSAGSPSMPTTRAPEHKRCPPGQGE